MKQRTLTAVGMALIFIPIFIFGHHFHIFAIFCGLLALLASFEFARVVEKTQSTSSVIAILSMVATGGVIAVGYLRLIGLIQTASMIYALAGVLLAVLVVYVLVPQAHIQGISSVLLIGLYVGLGFLALIDLRIKGIWILGFVLLNAILTDAFAYMFGIRFGRHRLAPVISPKKSVEGAIAGWVCGSAGATVFAVSLQVFSIHWAYILIIAMLLSVVAQLGDLVASKIKRDYGIKDFSNLLPGHGGVLDRFDSWIFAAMMMSLIVYVLNQLAHLGL
jgi:phosphatidate cytidylyltransferase